MAFLLPIIINFFCNSLSIPFKDFRVVCFDIKLIFLFKKLTYSYYIACMRIMWILRIGSKQWYFSPNSYQLVEIMKPVL